MKTRIYTQKQLVEMPANNFMMISDCLRFGSFRLMGIFYEKYIAVSNDTTNGDIIINWE